MAGVLETFFIMFESDAKKLDKGLAESDKQTIKLTDHIKAADSAALKLGEGLGGLIAGAAAAVSAALSVHAVVEGVLQAAEVADSLGKVADATGQSAQTIDAWGTAVAMSGGTAEGFQATLANVQAQMSAIDVTGKSRLLPFFEELGIDLESTQNKGKGLIDLLPQIAESFESMDKQKSLGIGKRLGLDMGTIMLLQQGRREVEAQLAVTMQLSAATEKNVKASTEFNDASDRMKKSFQGIFMNIAGMVLPAFTWLADGITKVGIYFTKHTHLIVGAAIAIGAAVLMFALPPMVSLAGAVLAAISPFLLIGAAVAAVGALFALAYDDIMNFIDGNDSMIGRILEAYPQIGEACKAVGEAFGSIWEAMKKYGQFIADMFVIIKDAAGRLFDAVWGFIGPTVTEFFKFYDAVLKVLNPFNMLIAAAEKLIALFKDFGIGEIIGNIASRIGGFVGSVVSDVHVAAEGVRAGKQPALMGDAASGIRAGKQQIFAANNAPLASMTSSSISNSTSNKQSSVKIEKVEVHTKATDADGISKSIGHSLGQQMRHASSGMDDGIAG